MNTDHLLSFLAVARHQNYTRAAEELLLSQSAVWRQMRQLEGWLGAPLFETIGRRLELSPAGESLWEEARSLLGHVERLQETVRAHQAGICGRLRIGASTTPGHYLLPGILGEFHRTHPGVELHFEVDNSAAILQKVLRNELDLGYVGGSVKRPELRLESCLDDEIVCFASPRHPLAQKRGIQAQDLSLELCVMREEGSATRELFESWIHARGCRLGRTMTLKSPGALKILVAEGIGFSFLSIHGVEEEIGQGRLERLDVAGLTLERSITMAWHERKHIGPAMARFLEISRARLQSHAASKR